MHQGTVTAKARIAALLLGDGGHATALVVVPRIDQRVSRQGEQPFVDGTVQRRGIAALEVGAPAAVDQQGIAGEYPRVITLLQVTAMRGGMPGGEQRQQVDGAQLKRHTVLDPHVTAQQAVMRRPGNARTAQFLEPVGGREVIGMYVGFQRAGQRQAQFMHQRQIPIGGFDHRID